MTAAAFIHQQPGSSTSFAQQTVGYSQTVQRPDSRGAGSRKPVHSLPGGLRRGKLESGCRLVAHCRPDHRRRNGQRPAAGHHRSGIRQ